MSAARRRGDEAAAVTAGFIGRFADIPVNENWQPQGAPHRPTKRFPAEWIGTRAGADDAACAAGFGNSHDRSDISRILYVDRNDHERRVAIDAAARREWSLGESHDWTGGSHWTKRLHDGGGHGGDGHVVRSQSSSKIGYFGAVVGHGGFAHPNPGTERFGEKMHAVEQEQFGALTSCRGAKSRDDGVLAARDGGHAGRIALW
jgi:hypothetical protein